CTREAVGRFAYGLVSW
nr:immunoglobulin heavy chain junction region [Macaca mulatta]MOX95357.1 immunoglobulin heavy chain junction region [Macaca mulatta]MOX96428.1 immunoglobulin heavy chain junction region [Macaca mulatta]MOX97098.1 immunoglobulin heavy chain junction region [Macaca mulatta]